jgi:glycerol-3-phosphate dehydrogenase (NAD(P)+)
MVENIGIVGAGSWGTAIAVLLSNNGHNVSLWARSGRFSKDMKGYLDEMGSMLESDIYQRINVTSDLQNVIQNNAFVVMALPSTSIRKVSRQMKPFVRDGQIVLSLSKGIEENTLQTVSMQIKEEIPQAHVAVLSGPSHAEEVIRRMPTTCVIGSENEAVAKYLQHVFNSDVFRTYTSDDVVGMEVGGALKNIVAIAAGISDGLGYGDNAKAALITRGAAEIKRLGVKMGGKPETFAGLTGVGDLIVTCTSKHSRNYRAGYLIGQGESVDKAIQSIGMVVEGVNSAKAALALSKKYGISMPIVEKVNAVLFDEESPSQSALELMGRSCKPELY